MLHRRRQQQHLAGSAGQHDDLCLQGRQLAPACAAAPPGCCLHWLQCSGSLSDLEGAYADVNLLSAEASGSSSNGYLPLVPSLPGLAEPAGFTGWGGASSERTHRDVSHHRTGAQQQQQQRGGGAPQLLSLQPARASALSPVRFHAWSRQHQQQQQQQQQQQALPLAAALSSTKPTLPAAAAARQRPRGGNGASRFVPLQEAPEGAAGASANESSSRLREGVAAAQQQQLAPPCAPAAHQVAGAFRTPQESAATVKQLQPDGSGGPEQRPPASCCCQQQERAQLVRERGVSPAVAAAFVQELVACQQAQLPPRSSSGTPRNRDAEGSPGAAAARAHAGSAQHQLLGAGASSPHPQQQLDQADCSAALLHHLMHHPPRLTSKWRR